MKIKSLIKKILAVVPHKKIKPNFSLAPQNPTLPDIFIFAVIDWAFRIQRPQHFAKALAQKGHRVFYVSNNFINTLNSNFDAVQLDPELPLYHIHLALFGSPSIYSHDLKKSEFKQLKTSLGLLLNWTDSSKTISLVNHAFWTDLALAMPNNQIVYDCMDDHAGFENTAKIVLEKEKVLLQKSDLVLASSQKLYDHAKLSNKNTALIRNATDYDFFKHKPEKVYSDPQNRKILGYYGAIAEWFDINLIEKLAQTFPEALILLIGNDTVKAAQQLAKYQNIVFTGEVEYKDLPYYLYSFDVCLIPFQIIPLTEATNPVKVYEYLSAGKPVISVNLPEIRELAELKLVESAKNHQDFCKKTELLLNNPDDLKQIRQDYAKHQTWSTRIELFEQDVHKLSDPLVSIIILTYNNLDLTKNCLASLEKYTDYSNYEIIIVDNASTDGTPEYLTQHYSHHKIILNTENKGFAGGNNIGLKAAKGDYLVILNNDTQVIPGWLTTLVNHLKRNPDVGLVGPVTNNIGNEAKIITQYQNTTQMLKESHKIVLENMGELIPMQTLAFFCVITPRKVFEKIGLLDEQFELGFFEDDDYCQRVEQAGYKISCARDVFVHHHLSASFNQLPYKKRQTVFQANKKRYEKKWGKWHEHFVPIETKALSRFTYAAEFLWFFVGLLFLITTGKFIQHVYNLWTFTVDDAYISLRYADNLANTGKILWNRGEAPVEGYTSFLHILWLGLGFLNNMAIVLWDKLFGILAILGMGIIFLRSMVITRKLFFTVILAFLYTVFLWDPVTAIHTVAGIETTFYFFLLFASALLFFSIINPELSLYIFKRRAFLFAVIALLIGLTRPEANLYELIFIISACISLKNYRLHYFIKNICLFYFLPGAIYFLSRTHYFGLLFPLPFYIKFNHSEFFPGLHDVKLFFHYYWPLLLTMFIFWLSGFKRHKITVITYACVFISGLLFSAHANSIMNYDFRFSWPLLAIFLASGWLTANLTEKRQFYLIAFLMAMLSLFAYKNYPAAHKLQAQSLKYATGLQQAHISLGKSLSKLSSHNILVTCDAGAIPFYSQWNTVDSCALNNKKLATYIYSPEQKAAYLLSQNPRVIVLISESPEKLIQPLLDFQAPLYKKALASNLKLIKTYQFMENYYLWVIGNPQDEMLLAALKDPQA